MEDNSLVSLKNGGILQTSKLNEVELKRVEEIKNSIDISDSQKVLQFGVGAQSKVSTFSDNMLSQVRAKDAGDVGETISSLMLKIKETDVNSLTEDPGFIGKLFGGFKHSVDKFVARYDKIGPQIDKIVDELDKSQMEMLKSVGVLDKLYDKNMEMLKELEFYIIAGKSKLEEINNIVIPEAKTIAENSGDIVDSQKVNDLLQQVNRFEKKLDNMLRSKQIAINTAPQIRLIQNGDNTLIEKIQTQILLTIPVWKQQIALSIELNKQAKTANKTKTVDDVTNEMLRRTSELVKTQTIDIAKQSERGIVEVETLQKMTSDIITTIDEVLRIQAEGKQKRLQAEVEMQKMQDDLKTRLLQG